MSHRPFLKTAIHLASALALLVSVMTSPIRPASTASGRSQPDCLRRNFGIPGKAATNHRSHVPATSRIVQVKALSSESKPDWIAPSAHASVDPAYSPSGSPGSERDSTAPGRSRASHPLRC